MAASASANSSATVACFLLLLALAVVVSAARPEAPAPAPSVELLHEADADDVVADPISTETRRCDNDMRWNDQLCRNVCGMFKFYGYEFNPPTAATGDAPNCCCCPGGATCTQL